MELQHRMPCSYLDLMPDLSSSLPPRSSHTRTWTVRSVDIEGQPIPADLQSGGRVAWAMMVPLSYMWLFRCVMLYCRVAWPWEMLTRLYVWLFRSMLYVSVIRVAILKHDIITLCAHAKLSDRVCPPVCLCVSKYLINNFYDSSVSCRVTRRYLVV